MTLRPLTYFWYKCDRATFRDENSHAVIDKSRTGIVANTIMPSVSLSLSWSPLPLDAVLLKNLLIDIVFLILTRCLFYPGSLWILVLGLYFMFYMTCCNCSYLLTSPNQWLVEQTLLINKLVNSCLILSGLSKIGPVFSFLSLYIYFNTDTHKTSR